VLTSSGENLFPSDHFEGDADGLGLSVRHDDLDRPILRTWSSNCQSVAAGCDGDTVSGRRDLSRRPEQMVVQINNGVLGLDREIENRPPIGIDPRPLPIVDVVDEKVGNEITVLGIRAITVKAAPSPSSPVGAEAEAREVME
jgi:hypothetical protein